MEELEFKGGVFTWFVGLPIVIIVVLTAKDNRSEILLTNQNKFKQGEEIELQINYFQKMIGYKENNVMQSQWNIL